MDVYTLSDFGQISAFFEVCPPAYHLQFIKRVILEIAWSAIHINMNWSTTRNGDEPISVRITNLNHSEIDTHPHIPSHVPYLG